MTKVAIYARYSSDNQREASIEDQFRLCREYAKRQGWQLVESYSDQAISGASLLRPGIQTLIKALVRAHRWRRKIESGQAKSITDLAEQEGVTDAYVCRLLPLTCLARDIVEAILDGRQPKGLRLAELLGTRLSYGTPRGGPGASAIDTKLLTEVRSRRRTVGSKAETDRRAAEASTCLSGLCAEAAALAGDVGRQGLAQSQTSRLARHYRKLGFKGPCDRRRGRTRRDFVVQPHRRAFDSSAYQ
jgi:hypothetical protein